MTYLVLDLETGFTDHHKRKGNFYYNPVVAIGLKPISQNTSLGDWVYKDEDFLNEILNIYLTTDHKILVGHNIKFDLLHLWKNEQLQNWLAQGGRIWDTQLAHYMLTAQQEKYPALREVAVRCYGCTERPKYMEEYWDKGIDTMNIPEDLVLDDVKNDVLDTEAIMLKQVEKAKKEGMYKLILDMSESILATTEMEFNGLYINQDIFKSNQEKIDKELEAAYNGAIELATPYWK